MSFPIEASVVHLQLLVALTAHRLWALNLHTVTQTHRCVKRRPVCVFGQTALCQSLVELCVYIYVCVREPSQDRPCDVTPDSASLHTLQYVGLA